MRTSKPFFTACFMLTISQFAATAQTVEVPLAHSAPAAATSSTVVPMLVRYDGVAVRSASTVPASGASITFLIYKEEKGGDPLWIETQSVSTDAAGRYEVYLGSTYSAGLPPNLFGTGEARWLEIQIAGEAPGPRTLLTSVPYALKAADAATLGGLPASAFALAGTTTATSPLKTGGITADLSGSTVTTTGGTNLYLPKFNSASTIIDSEIYDTGTSVGIGGIPNSSVKLDVNGAMIMRGNMQVTRTGTATAFAAYPSYGFQFYSNAYNSSTKTTDNPFFQLESEPTGNDTASPSASFNLLFSNNGSRPAETGFSINPTGTINFARGQTFPGTGDITGITTTSPLTGGGTSGSVALGLNTTALKDTLNGTYAQLGGNNNFPYTQDFLGGATVSHGFGVSGGMTTDNLVVTSESQPSFPYNFEVYSPTANVSQMAMVSGGTDAAISVNNQASGGREYWIDSGSGSAGIGAGNFGIFDRTAESTRLIITPSGTVAIGTVSPFANSLEVDSVPSVFTNAIYASGNYYGPAISQTPMGLGSNGVAGSGGSTDNSAGAMGGVGGYFVGGNADSMADAGYGLVAIGGTSRADGSYTYSANFQNSILVNDSVVSNVATSKIDHPSDPAHKYLNHASIQSSELMNLYTGNVTTDSVGNATVKLPEWFEAENADFRYQLTVIGGRFAQAIISKEISGQQFSIMSSVPGVKVSWQVTAIRQDTYAKAHPLVVEEAKPAREVGFYQHPELYGQPANKQTEWGRNPAMMQRMQAQRVARASKPQAPAPTPAAPTRPHAGSLHAMMQSSPLKASAD